MKKYFSALSFALCLLPHFVHAQPRVHRMVVVISLDGFPAYALDDPRSPIPTLRKLAAEGAAASNMVPINPTITWPNHTRLVTGVNAARHQVVFNGLLTREGLTQPPEIKAATEDRLVHAPTIYDVATKAGLTTAQVAWVAIDDAKNITWKFPECPNPDGKIEQEMVAAGVATPQQIGYCSKAPVCASCSASRDQTFTNAAGYILTKYHPDLLLLHLSTTDVIHHSYGPLSLAGFAGLAFVDSQIKQLLDTLKQATLLDRTTIVVVSDHGFRNISYSINPNVLLREHGLLRVENGKINCDAWIVPDGAAAMVYVTDPSRRQTLIPEIKAILAQAAGIEHVYGEESFPELGLPLPGKSDQAPDLFLTAKPDYFFQAGYEGSLITTAPVSPHGVSLAATHGFINSDPEMGAIFIAWGSGIKQHTKIGSISNLDVAPTVASLLGIKMRDVEGHPLNQIFKEK